MDMVLYLLFKAISTGVMLVAAILWQLGFGLSASAETLFIAAPMVSAVFVTLTAAVLVFDLERPERFYYILTRSNWRSWMVWGAYFLTAHGLLSAAWLAAAWFRQGALLDLLVVPTIVVAILATSYTGFLFAQGLGRDLWQGPGAAIHLVAQSLVAGSAMLLLIFTIFGTPEARLANSLRWILVLSVLGHLMVLLFEHVLSPSPTRHHALASDTFIRGPYARLFWGGAVLGGAVLPAALMLSGGSAFHPALAGATALLALGGGAAWEYIWVEAGQSVPLS
jgi:formate-dependent nitrite reductase membrane component NrfD